MMTLLEASVEEDRWSPVDVLIWIATRSRQFMDALKGLPLSSVEDRLWRLCSVPGQSRAPIGPGAEHIRR